MERYALPLCVEIYVPNEPDRSFILAQIDAAMVQRTLESHCLFGAGNLSIRKQCVHQEVWQSSY